PATRDEGCAHVCERLEGLDQVLDELIHHDEAELRRLDRGSLEGALDYAIALGARESDGGRGHGAASELRAREARPPEAVEEHSISAAHVEHVAADAIHGAAVATDL